MKTRFSLIVFLCVVLSLPVFAQQSASSQETTATTHETATGKPPLPVQSRPDNWWDGDDPGLAWLVLHPFASKKYVHRNTDIIRDRVNELDQLTSENSKQIQDVDSRAQNGIQLASTKTKLADDHTQEATQKAQAALESANAVNARLGKSEMVVGNIDKFDSANKAEIRFRPGQTVLSKQAKTALDQIATPLKDQSGYIIEVEGYSAGRGQTAIANSRKMADSVVRYLMTSHDIPAYRIYVVGMGNVPAEKHVSATRVEVSVLKNDVEQASK
jgi:outer membrane protein OmpA-like peptidoglycan-associated protein